MPPTIVTIATRNAGQWGVAAVACLIERPNGLAELVTAPLVGSLEMSEGSFLGATFALGEVDPTEPTILRTSARGIINALGTSHWAPSPATPIGAIEARHGFIEAARQFYSLRGELIAKDGSTISRLWKAAEAEARTYSAERMAACGFAPTARHAA